MATEAELIPFINELCNQSENEINKYFGKLSEIEEKEDKTPVTIADKNTEAVLRNLIEKKFPQHTIVGEEHGVQGSENAEFKWILDPIDGTKSFIAGIPLFGTLIALLKEGKPYLGCINIPCSKERMIGLQGRPTVLNGQEVRVSQKKSLAESLVLTTCPKDANKYYGSKFTKIIDESKIIRTWGDCYGHFMVASGRADVMIDPEMSIWDVAALKPCIEGAGGILTDINNKSDGLGNSAISSNGKFHEEIICILNPEALK